MSLYKDVMAEYALSKINRPEMGTAFKILCDTLDERIKKLEKADTNIDTDIVSVRMSHVIATLSQWWKKGKYADDCCYCVSHETVHIRLCSKDLIYKISAMPPHESNKNKGHLSCSVYSKNEEIWSEDLAKGDFSESTWHKIMADIVSKELTFS